MYLTKREVAMAKAQNEGYRAFRLRNSIPAEYKNQPHLKTAWEAGWRMAADSYNTHYT